jgi:hypothetical protein
LLQKTSLVCLFVHVYRPTDTAVGIDKVLEELARQNAEQRELLNNLSDGMKSLLSSVLSLTVMVRLADVGQNWLEEARFVSPHELGIPLRWGLARMVRYIPG